MNPLRSLHRLRCVASGAATQGLFEAASCTMEDLERATTAYRRDEPPEGVDEASADGGGARRRSRFAIELPRVMG